MHISLSYLAGFIDGEGSFSLTAKNPRCQLSVSQHARSICLLEEIKQQHGGTRLNPHSGGSDVWEVIWGMPALRVLLPKLTPHLIIKKPQAALAQEFFSRQPGNGIKWDRTWLSWAEQEMKLLKRQTLERG